MLVKKMFCATVVFNYTVMVGSSSVQRCGLSVRIEKILEAAEKFKLANGGKDRWEEVSSDLANLASCLQWISDCHALCTSSLFNLSACTLFSFLTIIFCSYELACCFRKL